MSITAVQVNHIESIRLWRNTQMDVLRQSKPIEAKEQAAYFDSQIWPTMAQAHPNQILVSIFEHDKLVGYGGLVHISWGDLRGELSFLLDPKHTSNPARYKELFSGFLCLAKILAFRDLGLMRLFTETYDMRQQHIKILESAGFLLEGRMKNHVRIGGRAIDSLIHGCVCDATNA